MTKADSGQNVKNAAGKAGKTEKSTTFSEFFRWLILRRQLRRQYASDVQKKSFRKQIRSAIVYLLLLTFVLSSAMLYARLHRRDTLSGSLRAEVPAEGSGNPALSEDVLTCSVAVSVGGEQAVMLRTPTVTVAEMLDTMGCTLEGDDYTTVPLDTVVRDGMSLSVIRVTYEESEETAAIPYDTVYVDSQTIPKGSTELISPGSDGTARQLQRRRYENGELTDTAVLSSVTVTEPVSEQMYLGVGGVVYGAEGAYQYSYYLDVTATCYGPPNFTGLTYTGTIVHKGTIAVDPTVIPLGSTVYVKGDYGDYGVCWAEDIGGGIIGNHIDIWMDATYEEMRQFGIRRMRVYVIK